MGLARLGVKKLILVDKENVETSNLNRQILFSHKHVGKPKSDSAKEVLLESHLLNPLMEVESYQIDAMKQWQKVVELSRDCTVVFNMIDVGEYFDAAVQALCMQQDKLLIQGGNFCQQFNVDFFRPGQPCLACSAPSYDESVLQKLLPSKIMSIPELEWIPRDRNPISQSNIYLCLLTCQMMVCRFGTLLINDPEVQCTQRFIMTINSGEAFGYELERNPTCQFCLDVKSRGH